MTVAQEDEEVRHAQALRQLVMSIDNETRTPPSERRRLLKRMAMRCILPGVLLLVAIYCWWAHESKASAYHRLSRTTTATVVKWDGCCASTNFLLKKVYNDITVTVKYSTGPYIHTALISPLTHSKLVYGQHLRIRYNPEHTSEAAFNGSAGDWWYPDGNQQYREAVGFLVLSIGIFAFFISDGFGS